MPVHCAPTSGRSQTREHGFQVIVKTISFKNGMSVRNSSAAFLCDGVTPLRQFGSAWAWRACLRAVLGGPAALPADTGLRDKRTRAPGLTPEL